MQYRALVRCLITQNGQPDSVKTGEIREFDTDPGKHWELVPGQTQQPEPAKPAARNTPRVTADVGTQPRTA